MASIASRMTVKEDTHVAAAADRVPLRTTLRLMWPKLGVAYLFVMLLSVYNRIMITELGIAATVVGLMYLTYNAMNVFQVSVGRVTDRRTFFGRRRTPMMFAGLMLSSFSLIPLPFIAPQFAAGNSAMFILMLLCMVGFGFGFAMNGDSHNTLIAETTEGKKNRPGVVAAVWLFQMICIVASGIITSILLGVADARAGAPTSCTTEACVQIRGEVALELSKVFFLAGPVVCLIGFLSLLGLERRATAEDIRAAQARPKFDFKQAYSGIFANPQSRVFFFFIVTAIFALFLQDDILEPFGGDVFTLSPRQTSQFQPMMGMATILAMAVMGVIASRRPIPKRTIANWGALMAAAGFALLALSATLHVLPLMYGGLVVLGVGMGVFNIGALSMMMDMTVPGATGSLMGAWGMAQALANGGAQFVGGFMRDAGIHLFGSANTAYSVIFMTSIVLCFVAISLMARVNVEKFRKLTREQMGLAIEAA